MTSMDFAAPQRSPLPPSGPALQDPRTRAALAAEFRVVRRRFRQAVGGGLAVTLAALVVGHLGADRPVLRNGAITVVALVAVVAVALLVTQPLRSAERRSMASTLRRVGWTPVHAVVVAVPEAGVDLVSVVDPERGTLGAAWLDPTRRAAAWLGVGGRVEAWVAFAPDGTSAVLSRPDLAVVVALHRHVDGVDVGGHRRVLAGGGVTWALAPLDEDPRDAAAAEIVALGARLPDHPDVIDLAAGPADVVDVIDLRTPRERGVGGDAGGSRDR
jgi:hypothetical protein